MKIDYGRFRSRGSDDFVHLRLADDPDLSGITLSIDNDGDICISLGDQDTPVFIRATEDGNLRGPDV